MLVLSRKLNESIVIRDDVVVTVLEVSGGKVRLGIDAPADVKIVRSELLEKDRGSEGKETK
jgi:carbon storage regulator